MFKLNDSFKIKTIKGLYRTIHPIETYNNALNKIKKLYPDASMKYIIDDFDGGLSTLYPRAVVLRNDDIDSADSWGKGVTPIASACSALMEFVEVESKIYHLKSLIGIDDIDKLFNDIYIPFENNSLKEIKELSKKFNLDNIFIPITHLDVNQDIFNSLEFSLEFIIILLAGRYELANTLNLDSENIGSGSYGAGTGNTYEEGILHSLIELIECLVEGTVLEQNRKVYEIDKNTIDSTLIKSLLEDFKKCNLDVKLSDWSCDLGVPAIAITYWSEEDEKHYYKIGTGTTREEAAQRAMTEFIQTLGPQRYADRNNLKFLSELRNSNISFYDKAIDFKSINNIDDLNIKNEIKTIVRILNNVDIQLYVWDITHPKLNIPVTQLFFLDRKYTGKITLENSQIIFENKD